MVKAVVKQHWLSAPIDWTGRRTHALLPDARLAVVEGAGHGLYMSDPARYNAELLGFADTLPAPHRA
ncbi:hypothetical protein GCM10009609_60410 [Pseudonocardia aurantiaca]